ncbi:hypothetical protein AK830_g10968 [Neonectria ditissima]|uniref:Prp 4 CRoW domain-containing protein n=1 Tax=Neonectria ditissima TaxID=78410 RepID=A0A0P7AS72_9HYPO|nr:hypothetical protein AK830_g10968 [Neonectria ditissima]
MLFRSAASLALLACVSNVAAQAQPYKLVTGPVFGISLARRSTNGYQPEQSVCGDGNTCAEACGEGFETCPSQDESTHCFNPAGKQTCCSDGSGNSCDDGYYCTHDTKSQTWCCPDSMDLVECAAAYDVDGTLEKDEATTSSAKPTTTSTTSAAPKTTTTTEAETTSSSTVISTTSSSKVETTSTEPETTSTPVATSHKKESTAESVVIKTEIDDLTTTVCPTPSAGYSTAWTGSNSTVTSAAPTQPYESTPVAIDTASTAVPPVATGASGASTTGVSALLLVAAGILALL